MTAATRDEVVEQIKRDLGEIEMNVLTKTTLSDLIRIGAARTDPSPGSWGNETKACALSGAALGAGALGIINLA